MKVKSIIDKMIGSFSYEIILYDEDKIVKREYRENYLEEKVKYIEVRPNELVSKIYIYV